MEKSKKEPIDPLLAQQYFADAAQKARGIIEWPAHEVAERPEHEIVTVVDPDREAARKALEAHQDYNFMKQFYSNDVDAMRGVKDVRSKAEHAEMLGKDPASFVGIQTPGTTENFIGSSENSVIRSIDAQLLENEERIAIDSLEKASKEYIDKIPERKPLPTAEEQMRLRNRPGGLFIEEPFDQDKVA